MANSKAKPPVVRPVEAQAEEEEPREAKLGMLQ